MRSVLTCCRSLAESIDRNNSLASENGRLVGAIRQLIQGPRLGGDLQPGILELLSRVIFDLYYLA